jgi:hypothetical protein
MVARVHLLQLLIFPFPTLVLIINWPNKIFAHFGHTFLQFFTNFSKFLQISTIFYKYLKIKENQDTCIEFIVCLLRDGWLLSIIKIL